METETLKTELNIDIVQTPPVSKEYEAFRDRIWTEAVEEGKSVGKDFYNGVLYRFVGYDEETQTVQLGLMQYSDRLLKSKISPDSIAEMFGRDHVMQHCVVNVILLTTDRRIAVGIKKNSVDLRPKKLAYIGGNLNANEVEVTKFEDIYTMMMKEIEEESSIVPEREKMDFVKLVVNGNWASFYFLYRLNLSSEEIDKIYKEGEFLEFETMTPSEIAKTERIAIGDFNDSKAWIESLIESVE